MLTEAFDGAYYRKNGLIPNTNGSYVVMKNVELFRSLPLGARVIDVGCGSGVVTEMFSKFTNIKSVLGIDYSADMVKAAKDNNPEPDKFRYEVADATDFSTFPPGVKDSFDLGFQFGLLQYLDAEGAKCLKSGGKLLISATDYWTKKCPHTNGFDRRWLFEGLKQSDVYTTIRDFYGSKVHTEVDKVEYYRDCPPSFYIRAAEQVGLQLDAVQQCSNTNHLTYQQFTDCFILTIEDLIKSLPRESLAKYRSHIETAFRNRVISVRGTLQNDIVPVRVEMINFIFTKK